MHSLRAVLALSLLFAATGARAQAASSSESATRPPLQVQLDPALRCPSVAHLQRALGEGLSTHSPQVRADGATASTSFPRVGFRTRGGGRLRVELQRAAGEPALVRTLRGNEDECEALADAAVLLVQSWLQGPARAAPPAHAEARAAARTGRSPNAQSSPPMTPPLVEAPSTSIEEAPSTERSAAEAPGPSGPDEPVAATEPAAPTPDEPVPEPAPSEPGPAAAEPTPSEPPPAEPAPSEPPPAPSASWRLLALGGGGWLVPSTSLVGTGALRVERDVTGRLGVGLQLGLESARTAAVAPGEVTATQQSLAALARFRFHSPEQRGPELFGGARLERLSATSRGYTENGSAVLWAPSLLAGAAWNQPISRRFHLQGWLCATARARREVFTVANVGEVLVLPPFGLSAGVGVGFNFL